MRVATYYSNQDIRIEEKPRPKIGPGELLIRVEAAGICGSDCMEWYRKDKVPLVLGHEIAGVVEEVGEGIKSYKKGDRITSAHHVPCGKCHYCTSSHETVCETLRRTNFDPGGFCEFLRLPAINVEKGVYLLPGDLAFEEATFVEPLACILRGQRIAGGVKGKFVLVIGSGIAGLLHILLAKYSGSGGIVATDISEYRLQMAKKFGATLSVNAKEYSPEIPRKLNQNRLADLVIVTSGAVGAIQQALDSVERGGTVLFFAPTEKNMPVSIPFNQLFWRQEITLTSAYAGSPADYQEALNLLGMRKLNITEMITHRLSLAQIGMGFKLVSEAGESLKVIIYPQKHPAL